MAAVGWTGFMLFLLLNISMGKHTERFTVSCNAGQTVTLPCNHTMSNCSMVTWILNSTVLVAEGKVKETQRSGRLTLGSDCSLHMKNLNTEDTGLYFCRLFHSNNHEDFTDISGISLSVGESDDGFPVVTVAASCVAVCVGVCITIVIIIIYKRRPDNHLSSSQVKVLDTGSLTYAVVDLKKSAETEPHRKTDNISVEYATIKTTQ